MVSFGFGCVLAKPPIYENTDCPFWKSTENENDFSTNPESNKIAAVSESRSEAEDSHYAGSDAHFGIHHEMLSDRVRTESYRDALQVCKEFVK